MRRRRHDGFDRVRVEVERLELPPAVFKTCPWQPRTLVEAGLRQWLRCCAAALRDGQTIGMPSRAVDEAWHGLILCTARYSAFCEEAYGRFLHHHPEGAGPAGATRAGDSMDEQLRRTALTVADLFDIVVRHGLHFDQARRTRVVFHMISCLTECGRIGLTAVGDSPEEAQRLYDEVQAVLLGEADRALVEEPVC